MYVKMPQKVVSIYLQNKEQESQCYPIYILNYKLIDNKIHKI